MAPLRSAPQKGLLGRMRKLSDKSAVVSHVVHPRTYYGGNLCARDASQGCGEGRAVKTGSGVEWSGVDEGGREGEDSPAAQPTFIRSPERARLSKWGRKGGATPDMRKCAYSCGGRTHFYPSLQGVHPTFRLSAVRETSLPSSLGAYVRCTAKLFPAPPCRSLRKSDTSFKSYRFSLRSLEI